MLGHPPFSHDTLRKYQMAFGTLFNDLEVVRRDRKGNVEQVIKVPLSWSRKDKLMARLIADPELDRDTNVVLPRMAYEMTSMTYRNGDKLRQVGKNNVKYSNTAGEYKFIRNPVPYDLHFNLYVAAKFQSDGNQIIEQILPFFGPHFSVTLVLIPEFDIHVDCDIQFNGVPSCEDHYDGKYTERRSIVWTLPFTMKAWLYGPERVYPIIKFANVNFEDATLHDDILDAVGNTVAIDRVTVQPGLDKDGNPTKDPQKTIPYNYVEKDDDWTFLTTIYGNLLEGEGSGGEAQQMKANTRLIYVHGSATLTKGGPGPHRRLTIGAGSFGMAGVAATLT